MKLKRHLIVFTAALFVLTFASVAKAADWIKFTSEPGRFSVLMPGPGVPTDKAETTAEPKTNPATPYTSHVFIQTSGMGVSFLVGWVDYAPGFKPNIQGELAANRDSFVKGVKAKVDSEHSITLGQYPGIEFTGSRDDGMTFKARVYMVGPRPYMLVALTPKGKDDCANAEKFFTSFKLK